MGNPTPKQPVHTLISIYDAHNCWMH